MKCALGLIMVSGNFDIYLEKNVWRTSSKKTKSLLLNSKAQRRSVNWQKRINKFQQSFSISTYSPKINGASRTKFHISQAVCLILNLAGEITLNSCGLFCLSISQYSKFFIALFIVTRVNCEVSINRDIIFVKMSVAIPSKRSWAKSAGNPSTAWK